MSDMYIQERREKIRAIAAGGIALALAQVLSMIKMFQLPQGGSVTPASILPIILFALCFGPAYGLGAGFIFSLLQILFGGYVMAPFQVLLDYILAYTALGLAGFFAQPKEIRLKETSIWQRLKQISYQKLLAATLVPAFVMFSCSFLSGILFYSSYAPEGQAVWLYSLLYNGSFILAETIIALLALGAIRLSLGAVKVSRANA